MPEKNLLQLNDEQVIEQVLDGNTDAYGTLVKRHWKLALAIAYCRSKDSTHAEDIAQECFIKAYQNLASLRNRSGYIGWLSKIIHQECIAHHRQQTKQATVYVDAAEMDRLVPVFALKANPGLSRQQIDFVHQAIRKLPENLQNVIIMRFVGGLPLKEIAQQIEIKYGTVRVWLHRAYKILKEDLAPILEEVQS